MMASGPKGRSTLILAWKMTTRTLVSALPHLLPGESDSATAASEPMCSKSSECIFRGGGAGEPAGDDSSSSSTPANPRAGFSAPIIGEPPPESKGRAGGSAQCRAGRAPSPRSEGTRAPGEADRSGWRGQMLGEEEEEEEEEEERD